MGWATAQVTVSGGAVTSVDITEGGSGYTNNEELFFDTSSVATGGIAGSPFTSSAPPGSNVALAPFRAGVRPPCVIGAAGARGISHRVSSSSSFSLSTQKA